MLLRALVLRLSLSGEGSKLEALTVKIWTLFSKTKPVKPAS